ncbi:hypothetical protein ACH4VR_29485 [Streptomyces sp. NPDC020883]|uniref:hypothetical protein n=1 Tax=Streptomyces sp. NPDC020883 TaxID=3365099 RepID=UPI0037A35338
MSAAHLEMSPGNLAVANVIADAGPGRHYLRIIRPQLGREALAEVLYVDHKQLALGGMTGHHFNAVVELVEAALSDTENRDGCGSSEVTVGIKQ